MEDVIQTIKRLSSDPQSQFFFKKVEDINKIHIQNTLRTSRYAIDREVYELVREQNGKRIVEDIEQQTFKSLLSQPSLSTRDNSTQFTVSDKGQRFQADLADIKYIRPRAHEPRYVLLIVDVYSQRIYLYGLFTKDRTLDAFQQFIIDSDNVRDKEVQIYIQTDEGTEFLNRRLKNLLSDNGIKLFTTSMNKGHAFFAEQKIRELKKALTKLKSLNKQVSITNMLSTIQTSMNVKHIGYIGLSPKEIERNYPRNKGRDIVRRLYIGKKITEQRDRQRRYHVKKDKRKRKRLHILKVGDLVYIAYGRILKKHYRGALDKSTTGIKPNFDTTKVFVVRRVTMKDGNDYYKLSDTNNNLKIEGRYYRDELYHLN